MKVPKLPPRIALNRYELAGAFGDLGTDLPLIMGMIAINQLDPASTFVIFGLLQVATGLFYGLPMPVQPLKAIATIMITTGARKELMYGAGLVLGITMVGLSISGLITRIASLTPGCVVRGIQFGLGMNLMLVAMGYMGKMGWIGWLLSLVGVLFVLSFEGNRRLPSALILIALGLLVAWLLDFRSDVVVGGLTFSIPALHRPSASDMLEGALLLALPQIPLSIANSLIATSRLAADLFPDRKPPGVGRLALTYGVMNVVAPFFSGIPVCHGCGGLAGHHRFGARTGGSVVIYGTLYLVLGGLFAPVVQEAVKIFPFPILGVLLFFEGFALVRLVWHLAKSQDELLVALLVGAVIVGLPYGYVVGMIGGTLLFHLLRKGKVRL